MIEFEHKNLLSLGKTMEEYRPFKYSDDQIDDVVVRRFREEWVLGGTGAGQ